jgi:hypothetical protein
MALRGLPMRFISLIAALPSFDKPPCTGPILDVDESANALLHTCVKVHCTSWSAHANLSHQLETTYIAHAECIEGANDTNAVTSHVQSFRISC